MAKIALGSARAGKLRAIVGLYLTPRPLLLRAGAKSRIEAPGRTRALLPERPEQVERQDVMSPRPV
ncbi:MAG: hypothetical protein ACREDD_12065 [Methylocella sp.]